MKTVHEQPFDYNSIPIGYYDEVFRRRRGIQSKWHHLKFCRVAREISSRARHLDVACGPGTFISTLDSSIESLGVDIAEAQILYAQTQYGLSNKRFRVMVPGKLPFDDSIFDVVTSVELIEHISPDDASQLLAECRRVLRPGGKLVITTPNYQCFWPMIEALLNRLTPVSYEDQHIARYKPATLRKLLKSSGFDSVSVQTCLFLAPFAAALGWKFSDWVDRIEPAFFTRRFGHLLIGTGQKP